MSFSESEFARDRQPAPRRHWLTPMVGVGLWLASVTAMTGLVSGVLWSLRASGTPAQVELDSWQWGSRDQKLAALREAYSGRRPVISDPRREEIEKFLNELTKSDDDVGEGAWTSALDEARFRRRIMESPWGKSLSWLDRRQLAATPISEFWVTAPNQLASIKLLQISPWANGDETLVFTFVRQGYRDLEPMLFWLSHSDGRWKVVDWEWVDSGWSETEFAANWAAMSSDPQGSDYELAIWKVHEADGLEYSQRDEYGKCLREAENYLVPGAVADYTRYLIMTRWNHRYHPEEVRRLASLVQEPDRVPGVHVMRAVACQRLGKTDEAFAALDRVEQLIGFRPSVVESRAQLLQQARRRDDALIQWRRLADFDPGEQSYLSDMLRLLPKNERSEILDRIKSHSEPLKLAAEVARFNQYQLDESFLKELSEFATSISPESAEARQIKIVRLEINDQYAEAAALSRQSAEQETDKEEQQTHWYAYLTQMHKAGDLLSGFAAHPDPKSAFQDLVGGLDENEAIIDVDDLPPLLAAYREKQPNDPWLAYYEGYYAAEKLRYAEADKCFAAAEKLLPEPKQVFGGVTAPEEDDDDVLSGLRYLLRNQRCRARYELSQSVEILEDYKYHETAFQTLAQIAVEYRHWHVLDRLNQSFATQQPRNLWLTYYEAKSLLAQKRYTAVHGKLRNLNARKSEAPGLEYYRDELELDLEIAEAFDPIAAYRGSKNPTRAFQRASQKLLAERDWNTLEQLCQQHRVGPNDPEVILVRLEQAWRQRDDSGLVKLLIPWPKAAFAQRAYYESTWRERLVRSLLRLNRWEEAHQQAQTFYQLHEEVWPLVMTWVDQGNAEEISKLLREDETFAESWKHRDFATDPQLQAVMLDDAFAEIRNQQLFMLPNYHDGESLTLLYGKPIELTESWLRERLSQEDASVEIQFRSKDSVFVVWKGRRFQLMAFPTPYFSPEVVDRLVPPNSRPLPSSDRLSVYLRQRTHLMIVPVRSDGEEPWNSPSISARELGSRLLNADVVGAIYGQQTVMFKYLIPLDEGSVEALASRRPLTEIDPQGFVLGKVSAHKLPPDEQQKLKKLFEARRAELNSPPILVDVLMVDDQIWMLNSFRIIDIRRRRFGGYELIAEFAGLKSDARFPELRPGIKFVIPIEQVYQFDKKSL